ncbi:hypothetical protein TR51_25520 [Kitasatospora griseola]|uniref:Uncharacterized protein n=1 Tax=Kitasatospora griseola TaxID=2064 RepID=A0A0D0PIS8_KITGR|nr:hypothetical protein [Kitasatospora griseola]KIQ62404.1 hypothetical protein TR51_25520 [Kitasatospora griseola]
MTDTEDAGFKLRVHICDQRRDYVAAFATEDQVLKFWDDKKSTCAFFEVDESPIPEGWTRLEDLMYPTCEHGMDGRLCAGPNHWE